MELGCVDSVSVAIDSGIINDQVFYYINVHVQFQFHPEGGLVATLFPPQALSPFYLIVLVQRISHYSVPVPMGRGVRLHHILLISC